MIPDGSFTLIAPLVPSGENEATFTQEKSGLRSDVKSIELSYSFIDNETRLQDIYSKLQKTPNEIKEVVLITDLQRNGWRNEDFSTPWLQIIDVSKNETPSNHAVSDIGLSYGDNSIIVGSQISNFSNDPVSELLTTTTLNQQEIREYTEIEPYSSSSLEASFDTNIQAQGTGTVSTTNDKLKVDDIRHLVADGQDENYKF